MHRSVFLRVATALACAIVPRMGSAQDGGLVMDVDAGGAWLHQRGIPESGAESFGATLVRQNDRAGVAAAALGACGSNGACTAQAAASAAVYAAPGQRIRWELSLSGSDLALDGARPTTSGLVAAREYAGRPDAAGYVGVGGGVAHGFLTRRILLAEAGGWWAAARNRWSGGVRVMQAPTNAQLDGAAQGTTPRSPTFADLTAGWTHDAGRLSMAATGGWRVAVEGSGVPRGAWASAAVTGWVTPRVAVVVAGGRALEDLTRGAPEARYVSVSLRVRLHGPAAWLPRPAPFPATTPVASATALAGGEKQIRIRVAGATRVEVMGDFTEWEPRPLTRQGDGWTLAVAVPAGPHRLAVRIDGGDWQVPANLTTVHDEFGGAFGLITIP